MGNLLFDRFIGHCALLFRVGINVTITSGAGSFRFAFKNADDFNVFLSAVDFLVSDGEDLFRIDRSGFDQLVFVIDWF